MKELSASGLADLAGVAEDEVGRLVELGVLVPRDGAGPFRETDVQKVRLAVACEQAGLPMAGIAAAVQQGRLSFAFLEAAPFRRWAVRSTRTYRQVSQETGVPLETLGAVLESMGFVRVGPDEPMREDELAVVPLLQLGLSSGTFDLAWGTRRCWASTAASKSCRGPSISSSASRASSRRPACWDGQSGSRRCRSWT
jgi:hypothetical protein